MLTTDMGRNLRLLIDDAVKEAFRRHKFFSNLSNLSEMHYQSVENFRRPSIAHLSAVVSKSDGDDLVVDLNDIKLPPPSSTFPTTYVTPFDTSTPKSSTPAATMNGRMISFSKTDGSSVAQTKKHRSRFKVEMDERGNPDIKLGSAESGTFNDRKASEVDQLVSSPPPLPSMPPSPAQSSTRRSSDDMSISSQSSESSSDAKSDNRRTRSKIRRSPDRNRRMTARWDEKSGRRSKRSRSRSRSRSREHHKIHERHRKLDEYEIKKYQGSRHVRERSNSTDRHVRSSMNGNSNQATVNDEWRRQSISLHQGSYNRILTNSFHETTLRRHSPIQFPKQDDATADERKQFTYFFTKKYPFSNHYPCQFKLKDQIYSCTEQSYMYEKAKLFNDKTAMADIMGTNDPKVMKNVGRSVSGFVQSEWDAASTEIMLQANYAKYSQNKDLRLALFATEGTTLVETNPTDCVWGIGLSMDDPRAWNRSTWRGKNLLGQILTHIRDDMIQQEKYADELSIVRADKSQFIWWNY